MEFSLELKLSIVSFTGRLFFLLVVGVTALPVADTTSYKHHLPNGGPSGKSGPNAL
jgi:hypothetical protein